MPREVDSPPLHVALTLIKSKESLATMEKLVLNCAESPGKEKFRKVRTTNEKIRACLAAEGAMIAMTVMGWVEQGDCLVLPPDVQLGMEEVNAIRTARSSQTRAVRISGVTGGHAALVNGVYHPVAGEACGGRPVYKKEGGDGWIEYSSTWGRWQVKLEIDRGKDVAFMYSHADTEAGAVEEVTRGWEVFNGVGAGFSVQAGVRVVRAETGSNGVQSAAAAAAAAAAPTLEAAEVNPQAEVWWVNRCLIEGLMEG